MDEVFDNMGGGRNNNVWVNRRGDVVYANPPAGPYTGYRIEIFDGSNSDEYLVFQDTSTPKTISGIRVYFRLSLSLIGQTVYAEMNVGGGTNLKNTWIPVSIPT